MKHVVIKVLASLLLVLAQGMRSGAGDFLIRDGDRVVFLGDSITEQRLYTTYIEAYALTRHPLYLGSAIMGAGFAIASHSVAAAILTGAYLAITITAVQSIRKTWKRLCPSTCLTSAGLTIPVAT